MIPLGSNVDISISLLNTKTIVPEFMFKEKLVSTGPKVSAIKLLGCRRTNVAKLRKLTNGVIGFLFISVNKVLSNEM